MDAFSLLRYWRTNNSDGTNNTNVTTSTSTSTSTATANSTTIVTSVSTQTSETGDEEDNENDHGPFFDLEFSLATQGDEREVEENGSEYGEEDDEDDSDGSERELKFTVLSGSSGESTADVNVSGSPSDELFFRGGFVPVEQTTEIDSKPPQFRLPLMKSATKIRVMMLKFRKSKLNAESSEGTESKASGSTNFNEQKKNEENEKLGRDGESKSSGKSMTVKLKFEEVPIVSLFTRRNTSKPSKNRQNDNESISGSSEEKKFSKETMQRYLRKVKISGEKLKFTGQLSFPRVIKPNLVPSLTTEEQKHSPAANPDSIPPLAPTNSKGLKQVNLPAGLRVVRKHLGKSWSSSTPVAAAAPPGAIPSKRRDDSLIQQQDGIQSAILHCKRSFKASRDADCSSSDPVEHSGECENRSSYGALDVKEAEEMKKR